MIDAGATELFRPREVVRTRGEAGPDSAVTKVPLFSDADTISSESEECFELMSMTSEAAEDRREFRVALDSLRGGGTMIVCGAE